MRKKAFLTSFTHRTDRASRGAFTLVELMVGAALSGILLTGVLSAFISMARVSANIQNYTDIENTARKTLEIFSRDVRLACNVENDENPFSPTEVRLLIPDNSGQLPSKSNPTAGMDPDKGAYEVIYKFNADQKTFTRTRIVDDVPETPTVLATNVDPIPDRDAFIYYRYITGAGYVDGENSNLATPGHPLEVKQIEINFLLNRTTSTVATASNKVLSARFILRNK